jgi:transposase
VAGMGVSPSTTTVPSGNIEGKPSDGRTWLFVCSEDGAHANATFVSLLAARQVHGIEPTAYLRDLFCLLPTWKHHRVLELAPLHWAETRLRPEVAVALEATPFRRVVLGMSPSSKT